MELDDEIIKMYRSAHEGTKENQPRYAAGGVVKAGAGEGWVCQVGRGQKLNPKS